MKVTFDGVAFMLHRNDTAYMLRLKLNYYVDVDILLII